MKIKEKSEEMVVIETVTHIECDECKQRVETPEKGEYPEDWHTFNVTSSCHYNDMFDWYEVCSPTCYAKKIKHILSQPYIDDENEIDDMKPKFAGALTRHILN